jgi:hypothetical protein
MNPEEQISPQLKEAITNAFIDGVKHLVASTHGIIPDDVVVLNIISALCMARKRLGFSDEQTRDQIIAALNTNMIVSSTFGGKK